MKNITNVEYNKEPRSYIIANPLKKQLFTFKEYKNWNEENTNYKKVVLKKYYPGLNIFLDRNYFNHLNDDKLKKLYDGSLLEIIKLKEANKEQNVLIQDLQRALKLQISENNFLVEDDVKDEIEKEELRRQIAELEALAATPPQTIKGEPIKNIITVDASTPTSFVNPKKSPLNSNIKKSKSSPYRSSGRPGKINNGIYEEFRDDRDQENRDNNERQNRL